MLALTDVMIGRPCYEVTFSDGSTIVADAEHQWLTETRASRRSAQEAVKTHSVRRVFPAVRTTEELAATLRCETADRRLNHSVTNAQAIQLPHRELLLSPYVLGAWLGNGISAAAQITSADPGIVMRLEAEEGLADAEPEALSDRLRTIGVLNDKHVPVSYLRASEAQRRDLLAGLLDTDGTVAATGAVQFAVTNERFARGVQELVVSLGYRCTVMQKKVAGRSEASSVVFTLNFTTDDDVFHLERKRLLHKERRNRRGQRHDSRFVTAVRPIRSVPVRCVESTTTATCTWPAA